VLEGVLLAFIASHQHVVFTCTWLIKTVLSNKIHKQTQYNCYLQKIVENGGKPKICYIKWLIAVQPNSISRIGIETNQATYIKKVCYNVQELFKNQNLHKNKLYKKVTYINSKFNYSKQNTENI